VAGLDLEKGSAAAGLGLALLVSLAAIWVTAPPDPLPASAPPTDFASGRAMAHVEALAAEIHPIGSGAHQSARDYVIDQLERLGLEPEVQTAWAGEVWRGPLVQGRVENVLTRIAGEGDGRAVLLMSHYDSVPSGPGAGDAAAGTATILETVRALLEDGPLHNDLIVLVTDGEEAGLLGARAFAAEHPWMQDVDLVLNFEARGNSGAVTMFETGAGNAWLMGELARAAPYPWASSLSYEVYRRMPNDTDFTIFRRAGVAGFNFAMIGNHPAYHTELDSPELLDQRSLQHMGSYALALARHFGDLELPEPATADAVYFNPFGFVLVVYPAELARAMAIATLLLATVVVGLGVRRNALDLGGVVRGAISGIAIPIVCALVLGALWKVVGRAYPELTAAPHGDPYRAGWIVVAFVLVSLGLTAFVSGLMEATRSGSLRAGVLVLWAVITGALSFTVTGASYLTLWPALLGAVALTVSILARRGARDQAVGLMIVVPVVTAAVFAPIVRLVGEALSVGAAPILGAVIGFALTMLVPDLREVFGGRIAVPLASVLVGVALLAWVGRTAAPGPATPGLTSLLYALDVDQAEASFVSYETNPSDWTTQVFPVGAEPGPLPGFLPGRPDRQVLSIAAPVLDLAPPTAELVGDVLEDGIRTLTVLVRSRRGAPWVSLAPDASMATILQMGVSGREVELGEASDPPLLMLQGVPAVGVEVTFRLEGRQPFSLGVLDTSFGLPVFDGLVIGPRPEHLMRSTHWLSDTTSVHRSVWF
jgi:hypothetical protein